MKKYELKDSGERRKFDSGMVRDVTTGKGRFDLLSFIALVRLVAVYEKGAKKYKDRNWEKGAPFTSFIDSALRHITQWMLGYEDEDNLAQAAWNLFSIMHLQETHPELDDRPFKTRQWDKEKELSNEMEKVKEYIKDEENA